MSSIPTTSLEAVDVDESRDAVWRRLGVGAFVVTRLWVFLFLVPISSDRIIYFEYAVRGVDLGQTAFEDFSIEYPPVAYWVMAAPRLLATEFVTPEDIADQSRIVPHFGAYSLLFRLEMLLCDMLAFVLFADVVRRSRPEFESLAVWGYVGVTTALAHVLYDRLDVGLLALLLGWLALRVRVANEGPGGRLNAASYAVLGLGIAYKLVGIVALPFVLLSDFQASRGSLANRLAKTAMLGVVAVFAAAAPFLVHAASAGSSTLGFLSYHGARGIEIESTYGSGLLVASAFGLPVETNIDFGSANLASPWSASLARVSPFVLLAVLATLGIRALRAGRTFDRRAGDRAGMAAILLTLLLSKVLSAQYLLFGLPLLLLVATNLRTTSQFRMAVIVTCVVAVLTTIVFPYLWFPLHRETGRTNPYVLVPDLHWLPCSLLVLRNLLLAVSVLLVLWFGGRSRGGLSTFPGETGR